MTTDDIETRMMTAKDRLLAEIYDCASGNYSLRRYLIEKLVNSDQGKAYLTEQNNKDKTLKTNYWRMYSGDSECTVEEFNRRWPVPLITKKEYNMLKKLVSNTAKNFNN